MTRLGLGGGRPAVGTPTLAASWDGSTVAGMSQGTFGTGGTMFSNGTEFYCNLNSLGAGVRLDLENNIVAEPFAMQLRCQVAYQAALNGLGVQIGVDGSGAVGQGTYNGVAWVGIPTPTLGVFDQWDMVSVGRRAAFYVNGSLVGSWRAFGGAGVYMPYLEMFCNVAVITADSPLVKNVELWTAPIGFPTL